MGDIQSYILELSRAKTSNAVIWWIMAVVVIILAVILLVSLYHWRKNPDGTMTQVSTYVNGKKRSKKERQADRKKQNAAVHRRNTAICAALLGLILVCMIVWGICTAIDNAAIDRDIREEAFEVYKGEFESVTVWKKNIQDNSRRDFLITDAKGDTLKVRGHGFHFNPDTIYYAAREDGTYHGCIVYGKNSKVVVYLEVTEP